MMKAKKFTNVFLIIFYLPAFREKSSVNSLHVSR